MLDNTGETELVGGSTRPRPFVFVLMPFSESFKDIYELGLKQACREAGAYCERVDEQLFDESILDRVYNQIAKADVIVADMTGRNPNVFYETGYAHALGKRVILLTQNTEDIPFDLKHYPHIIYEGRITTLKEELIKRIRWCIENPKDVVESVDAKVELLVNGHELSTSPTIACEDVGEYGWVARLELQVHNVGSTILQPSSCSVGLVVPNTLVQAVSESVATRRVVRVADGGPVSLHTAGRIDDTHTMIELSLTHPLLPDARETFNICLGDENEKWEEDVQARLFTEFGPRIFSFTVRCPE